MSQFVNLCFEGGGVKGIAYAGALKVLEERGVMPHIRRVAGTSAGAISAALVAMGADWQKVKEIVGGTDFREFMDHYWLLGLNTHQLLHKYGLFKGKKFSEWMRDQIQLLTGNADLTFSELWMLSTSSPQTYRDLSMVGTNLNRQKAVVYNAVNSPDMPIWEAARISMSIPLFFGAYRDESEGVLVDGGVSWNYPLDMYDRRDFITDLSRPELFDEVAYPTTKWDDQVYNKQTLGLRVDNMDEIKAMKHRADMPPVKIENIVDYAKAILNFMLDMANKAHLHQNDWHRTVFIDALDVKTCDFDLSRAKVDELVQSGEKCANKYFDWFDAATPGEALNKIP
ncbi:patatin-like phospholipase family protein [Pseudodesulfovibrio karagichevae]|uniref:Patatin-like phospholipase family protein n=1 Tax=Pseudodesulfovibrio karagichevae TaxID=3239305 RepID=A0ABV4K6C1_9BACT